MKSQNLNEFLSIPTGLELIADIDDLQLYSSDSLKEKFIKELSENKISKNSSDLLSKLVYGEKLFPCWTQKSFLGNLFFKVFAHENILGLYVPSFNKIFIVMNANINSFGFSDNDMLAKVSIHECCHMSAANSKSNFLKLWEDELTTYYTSFFKILFQIVDPELLKKLPAIAKAFYTDIYNSFEHSTNFQNSSGKAKLWSKIFSKYSPELISNSKRSAEELNSIVDILNLFARAFFENINYLIQNYQKFKVIWIPLFLSYKSLKIPTIPQTMPCQELFYPSEVICVLSSHPTAINQSKLKQTLSLIKI